MDFKRVALATLISSLLVSSVYANQQKDDEQDSVHEWGPWAMPVTTAAGPEVTVNPLVLAGGAGSEYVFFDAEFADALDGEETFELGCQPGAACGYATYYPLVFDYSERAGRSEQGAGSSGLLVRSGVSSLTPVIAGFSLEALGIDGGEGAGSYGALQYSVTPQSRDGSYIDIVSLTLDERARLGAMMAHYGYDEESLRLDGLTDTSIRCLGNCRGRYAPYMRLDYGRLGGLSGSNLSHGLWLSGAVNQEAGYAQAYLGSFVYGVASTLDSLSSLQAELETMNSFAEFGDNLVAMYRGHTAWGAGVELSINFSDHTWDGAFNNGYDGQVMAYTSDNGTSVVGQVGFNIEGGTIDGINLYADSNALSAVDGSVSGVVNASFFGANAGEIGGVADIVKTTAIIEPNNQSESVVGYENAVHVTSFSTSLQLPEHVPSDI